MLIPVNLTGAALVLIFAAIMSSADTQIFVLSSSVAVDWLGKFSKKPLTEKQLMIRTRMMIVVFSAVGFLFAYFLRDLVAVIRFWRGIYRLTFSRLYRLRGENWRFRRAG